MLTEETYFSEDNNMKYTSNSQIKSFIKCEAKTMAEIKGEWQDETSISLLVGSYVDAAMSGTLDCFKEMHPEILKKDGTLKSDYIQAEKMIQRMQKDEMFNKYISGNHQTIMTAKYDIENHTWHKEEEKVDGKTIPIKIKIDSYFPDKAIVDLKTVTNFKPLYNEETRQKENFVDYWRYTLQGALYQKVVEVNTGKKLPFFIAAITKETEPDIALLNIDQDTLDNEISILENGLLFHIYNLKSGEHKPNRCEHCNYCKATKKITEIINYKDIGKGE